MAKVSNTMKTRIAIDTLSAEESLKSLKQIVGTVTNAWKAQEAQFKSTGDFLKASEARYKGLSEAMEHQQHIIDNQKQKQRDLGNVTEENSKQYLRFENDINRAEQKLASMSSQQDRAKQSLERQIAGINSLNAEMKRNATASDSYVRLLKSQGDEESAVNAKRKATTTELKNQEAMYQKQDTLLKQVARESGYTSEAYQKQRVALQNTASAINETKQKLEGLSKEQEEAVRKTQTHKLGVDKLRESMKLAENVSNAYISALDSEGSKLKSLAGRQSELMKSRERAAKSVKSETALLESMGRKLGTTSDAYKEQKIKVLEAQGSYNKFNNELKETRVELARISPLGVNKLTTAVEKLKGSAGHVKSAFAGAFSGVDKLARGATVAMGAVTVGTAASVKMAANLQDQYVRTMNLMKTGGESASEAQGHMNEMLRDGRKYSVNYGVSQGKIADGYQELVKRGYEGAQAVGAMKSMLEASVASGDDFNTVVGAASATIESYGYKSATTAGMVKNTSEVVNKMAFVADKTATDFKGMGVSLEYAGATAHAIGIPLSQTASMIGVLSNNGLEAQKAGTGLRKVLNALTAGLDDSGDSTDKTAEKTAKYEKQVQDTTAKIQELQARQGVMTDKGSSQYVKLTNQIKAAKNKLGNLKDKMEDITNTKTKQSALESIGLDAKTLKNSNGEMRSVSEIFTILNDKTQNMGKGEKAALFTKLFGTTGQQAALMLSENSNQIDGLAAAADNASKKNYVSELAQKNMKTANASIKRLKMAAEAVASTIGAKFLPALDGVARSVVEAFDSSEGQAAIEELGKAVGSVADDFSEWVGNLKKDDLANVFKGFVDGAGEAIKITGKVMGAVGDFVSFCANHQKTVEFFAKAIATMFVISRVTKFIGGIKELSAVFGAQTKSITIVSDSIIAQNKLLQENVGLKEASGKANMGGAVSGGAGVAGEAGTVVEGAAGVGLKGVAKGAMKGAIPLALISSLVELIGTNKKNVGEKVGGATGGFGGTLAGASAGAALGSVVPGVGTAIGGLVGGLAGSFGGEKIGESIGKAIQKGLGKTKLKTPKVEVLSSKGAYEKLNKEAKKYYSDKEKTDKKDLDILKKNGMITNKEYKKRVNDLKTQGSMGTKFEEMSQKDRTTVGKYYSQQRNKLEEKYSKQTQKTKKKWNKTIEEDTKAFGASSIQVQKDIQKRDEELGKISNKKKKALENQKVKFVKGSTLEEAKLHTTLDGKIQLSSNNQIKILDNMVNSKKKLTNKQLQNAVNKAQEESEKVQKLAEQEYNATKKTAEKQEKSVVKAAERQKKESVAQAEAKYKETVDKAYKEFKGTGKHATEQRTKAIKEAENARTGSVNAANDQYNKVVDKAGKQKNATLTKAREQSNKVQGQARDQARAVKDKAKDQSKGVVTHAVRQANGSIKAQHKQGKGTTGIWNAVAKFFNGIGKFFHMDTVSTGPADLPYSQVTMPAIATGGIAKTGPALVGEAGPEAKYSPYSGNVEFVGMNGAEVVNLQAGEHILNAGDTAKLFSGGLGSTMKGYAKGTGGVSGFLSKMMDSASSIWDNVSEAAEKAMDKLTHPIKTLKDIASKTFSNNVKNVGSLPKKLSGSMTDKVINSVGDALVKVKKAFDDNGGGSADEPNGAGVQRWKPTIKKAAKKMGVHLTANGMAAVLRRIAQESNGSATISNNWDSNAKAGTPSKGLLQYIKPTLDYWVPKGVKPNLGSGYAQLMALFNDSNWLRDISVSGGWGPTGHKKMANGGLVSRNQMIEVAEQNKAEMIIPLDHMKRTRGWELLMNVASQFLGEDSGTLGKGVAGNTSDLEKKVEDLTDKMSILMDMLMQQKTTEITIRNEMDGRETSRSMVKYLQPELDKYQMQQGRLLQGRRN